MRKPVLNSEHRNDFINIFFVNLFLIKHNWQNYVFISCQLVYKIVGLKNKAESSSSQNWKLIVAVVAEPFFTVNYISARCIFKRGENVQKCGFAWAWRTCHGAKFSLLKRYAHVVNRLNGAVWANVFLCEVFTFDYFHFAFPFNVNLFLYLNNTAPIFN